MTKKEANEVQDMFQFNIENCSCRYIFDKFSPLVVTWAMTSPALTFSDLDASEPNATYI